MVRTARIGSPPAAAGGDDNLQAALRNRFGLEAFRPLQREIISTVLAGHCALAILPTGGGKSLCYQLPALLLPGVTIVVSPLISLMKDQVDALAERRIPAAAINSQDPAAETARKLGALARGQFKLAFVAPERLKSAAFLAACARLAISLIAVDEAHCVSQWGHDFRPDYRFIRDFRAAVGAPPLLALTATARPDVQRDIVAQLGIIGAQRFAGSSDRPNLWLGFQMCARQAEKRAAVARLVRQAGGSAIVYVSSRRDAEEWALDLTAALREPVAHYHAGLPAAARTQVQDRFMAGEARVVVATNAFGMGIDKPDIRAVIHAGVPESVEAYFQEVGRAGRDGRPANCTMVLLAGRDLRLRQWLLERERPDRGAVEAILRRIAALPRGEPASLPLAGDDADALATLVLSHLQGLGLVEVLERTAAAIEVRVVAPVAGGAAAEVWSRLETQYHHRWWQFSRVKDYIYLRGCRRQFLLRYFGERLASRPPACCSGCQPSPAEERSAPAPRAARRGASGPAGGAGPATTAPEDSPPAPGSDVLAARLKEWRRARARELQVPAFAVLSDRHLGGIAARMPLTLDELAACPGIGPAKLAQMGAQIVGIAFDCFLEWLESDTTGAWKAQVRRLLTPEDYRAIRAQLAAGSQGAPGASGTPAAAASPGATAAPDAAGVAGAAAPRAPGVPGAAQPARRFSEEQVRLVRAVMRKVGADSGRDGRRDGGRDANRVYRP